MNKVLLHVAPMFMISMKTFVRTIWQKQQIAHFNICSVFHRSVCRCARSLLCRLLCRLARSGIGDGYPGYPECEVSSACLGTSSRGLFNVNVVYSVVMLELDSIRARR